jgi:hypothetical protein
MEAIPARLLNRLSPGDAELIADWWAGLADSDRTEVVALCDARLEECFFGVPPADQEEVIPVVIGGRFVPGDDAAGWAEWHAELFDHLLCHPDLVFLVPPVDRKFHIGCTRHEAARAALAAGSVPADFRCPLDEEDCPMRRLLNLAPNHGEPNGVPIRTFVVHSPASGQGC